MPKHINSASRVAKLLRAIPGHKDNTQVLEVWADYFRITEPNPRKAHKVAERLNAMNRELDIVRAGMQAADFSPGLYEKAINGAESALSPLLMSAGWSSAKQYLKPETLQALEFCGEILANEESQIDEADLATIRSLAEELHSQLTKSTLPARLRLLIEHHLNLIYGALTEYPITGAKAFRQAARTAVGEILEVQSLVKEFEKAPELSKLSALWARVNTAADVALKVAGLVELAQQIKTLLPPAS